MKQHFPEHIKSLILITALFFSYGMLSAQSQHTQQAPVNSSAIDAYLLIPDSMLQVRFPSDLVWWPELGCIRESEIPKEWKFNADTFLMRYATLPLAETYPELNYYYDDYVMHLGVEGRQQELERMRMAAKLYGSSRLKEEMRFLEAFLIYGIDWDEAINNGRKVANN